MERETVGAAVEGAASTPATSNAGNVKRRRDRQMALRWCAAGMVKAGKRFRRVNGHLHLPTMRAALEHKATKHGAPDVHSDQVSAA